MADNKKKKKTPYNIEEDIERLGKKRKTKLTESVKAKKAADKKKAEEGDWVSRLRSKVKKYLKGERKAKKKVVKK